MENLSNRELALQFIACFCSADIDGIAALLAPNLQFEGPLFIFRDAAAYLDSLHVDPPEKCGYRILSVTENKSQVAVFYEIQKPGQSLEIAQLFTFDDGRIREMQVIFDSKRL